MSLIHDAPWRGISPSWATARRLAVAAVALLAMGVASLILWAVGPPQWVWAVVLGPLLGIGLLQLLNSGRVCRARQYAETADELLERHGLLTRSVTIVPYGRLQTVDVTQGPFERMLGLASVKLQSASVLGTPVVSGLEHADAQALAERLTARAKERQWAQ